MTDTLPWNIVAQAHYKAGCVLCFYVDECLSYGHAFHISENRPPDATIELASTRIDLPGTGTSRDQQSTVHYPTRPNALVLVYLRIA
jgi:hypothetical protein